MSPEWSIIILTALAGIAEGVLTFIVAADIRAATMDVVLSRETIMACAGVATLLSGAGAFASFFHLHHKIRGAKAIIQWRLSWLSREALLLPAFIGLSFLYGAAAWFNVGTELRIVIGLLGVATGVALGIASGMIYAVVTYIKEWATPYTPINFVLVGLAAGSVMTVAIMELTGAPVPLILSMLRGSIMVVFAAFVIKMMTFHHNKTAYVATTLSTAIGVNNKDVTLMDMGAAYDHYNTKEYYHRSGRKKAGAVKAFAMITLFIAPLLILVFDYYPLFKGKPSSMAIIAALLMVVGSLSERWLFFVQGNHVQNLYYGLFPARRPANPILQAGKGSAPLPPR